MRFVRWVSSASVACALLFCAGAPAFAQSAPEPSPAEVSLARDQFKAGMDAANQSRWEDAKRAFQRSYELYPRPLTLLNLAGAQAQSGELVASSENYRKFIREANAPPASEQKPAAQQALAQVEARLARLKLRVDNLQPDDRIDVDGRRVSTATLGLSVPMDPGDHKVVVSRSGAELTRMTFHLDERESRDVSLSVAAGSAAAPVAPAPASSAGERRPDWFQPTPEKKEDKSSGGVFSSPWFWGVTTAALIGGGIAIGVVASKSSDEAGPTAFAGNVPPNRIVVK